MGVSTSFRFWLSFSLWMKVFHITILNAMDDVQSFTVVTSSHSTADSDTIIYITLWYKSRVYQHSITNPVSSTTYTANGADAFVGCTAQSTEAKIMFQNDVTDSTAINLISFTTSSGEWFGIEEFCIDTALYGSDADRWLIDDNPCSNGYSHYSTLCIDNEKHDCRPYKQTVYFDLTKPNQYIDNAVLEDGSNMNPSDAIVSCPVDTTTTVPTQDTTSTTTNNPSKYPTDAPFTSSTNIPSTHTTFEPTEDAIIPSAQVTQPSITVVAEYSSTEHKPQTDAPLQDATEPSLSIVSDIPSLSTMAQTDQTEEPVERQTDDPYIAQEQAEVVPMSLLSGYVVIALSGLVFLSCCCTAVYLFLKYREEKRQKAQNKIVEIVSVEAQNKISNVVEVRTSRSTSTIQSHSITKPMDVNAILQRELELKLETNSGKYERGEPELSEESLYDVVVTAGECDIAGAGAVAVAVEKGEKDHNL